MKKETCPVLISDRGEKLRFFYNGIEVEGYSNETFADALNAAGISESGKSSELQMPLKLMLMKV